MKLLIQLIQIAVILSLAGQSEAKGSKKQKSQGGGDRTGTDSSGGVVSVPGGDSNPGALGEYGYLDELNPGSQEAFEKSQEKAAKKGQSGNGGSLIEPAACISFDSVHAQTPASRTMGSCKNNDCGNGCCRYHTAFLTCDESNAFSHLTCICNGNTASVPSDEDKEGEGSGSSNIELPDDSEEDPVVIVGTPESSPTSCEGIETYWQSLGLEKYQNCERSSDCDGVLLDGEPTCCKRAFCWCGAYDVESEECV